MERIVNHPILTIPQEGEHTFFIQWQTRNGNEGVLPSPPPYIRPAIQYTVIA